MTDTRFQRLWVPRLTIWALLMVVTASIVGCFSPHKAVYVPCIFVAIMTPMVAVATKTRGSRRTPGVDHVSQLNLRLALIVAGGVLQLSAVALLFRFGPRGSCMAPIVFTPLLISLAVLPLKRGIRA